SSGRSILSPRRRSLTQNCKRQVDEAQRYTNYNAEKEPIKAYLRLRPTLNEQAEEPYIKITNDVEISMTPPLNSNAYRTRHRAPEKYRFTKVFKDTVNQGTFFEETTLDLVKDVLNGDNALIFAYGVTNSGKTFTVMGNEENAGLLPRALHIMLNSIQHLKSEAKIKPVMHSLAQTYDDDSEENRDILNLCNIETHTMDPCTIDIDTNFEYGIWVSFIEVYNEQVYDLLDTTKSSKRNQLHLKYEQRSGNKYVAEMNRVRVHTFEEAYAIMKLGQKNRQVFSTLMNQTSSRSHSIFTIHVVKCPIMEEFIIEDPHCVTVSKLSIVDLAGSERYKNTNSTGQRLKEAGNINKSLMVLGQCMEVLRLNQIKAEMGKNTAVVPFRHSKLTELFKSTFEGNGKAVIIVNVNPFDTGFDENSHVMKFAAVAKDITTWKQMQSKILDLQQIETSTKRRRHHESQEDLLAQLDVLRNKVKKLETLQMRATHAEMKGHKELKEMEEMYLLALKRESDQMEIQISDKLNNTIDERDSDFLTTIQQRQQILSNDLNYLKLRIEENKQSLVQEISEGLSPAEDDDDDLQKENDDPVIRGETTASFQSFLSLRKQLRKSIFKREELCKDADTIMNQVEKFDGVTFELAKDTKMGKLLKLIAQEEFEKDPYQIRNRAIRLFKRYAQLPMEPAPEPPRKEFSAMTFSGTHDHPSPTPVSFNVGFNVATEKGPCEEEASDQHQLSSMSVEEDGDDDNDEDDRSSDIEKVPSTATRHKKRRYVI
ncbi:hypothetical protein INT47_005307, partial [Mucor saturninus]